MGKFINDFLNLPPLVRAGLADTALLLIISALGGYLFSKWKSYRLQRKDFSKPKDVDREIKERLDSKEK